MPKQFDDESCVFCSEPSSRSGEHVWPRWFVKLFPSEDGPYSWSINGEPVRTRVGAVRRDAAFGSVKVPVCSRHNGVLADRFESAAKPLIRRLFSDDVAVLGGQATVVVGLWLVKTWLLLAHPGARHSDPAVRPEAWGAVPHDLWSWMVDPAEAPPAGLSLWVSRRRDGPDGPSTCHIALPTVVTPDETIEFVSKQVGVKSLDVSLAYHPGWQIDHPLERDGRALRLWPRDAEEPVDFSTLPATGRDEFAWMKGPRLVFRPGMFPHQDLPPLSSDTDLPMHSGLHRFVTAVAL